MADIKTGFKFYNVDTDRYQDMKIKRLKKKFKCDGIAVYDYILCEVYRVRGCYTEWDDNFIFDVADYFGIEEELVVEIVKFCCTVGLFDFLIMQKLSVITSRSIQGRFIDMSKRSKRFGAEIPEKIQIIQEESEIIREQSDIVQEVSTGTTEKKGFFHEKIIVKVAEIESFMMSNGDWVDGLVEVKGITKTQLVDFIKEFTEKLKCSNVNEKKSSDLYEHFFNWLNKKLEVNDNTNRRDSESKKRKQYFAEKALNISTGESN